MNWKGTKRRLGLSKARGTADEKVTINLIPVNNNGKFEEEKDKPTPAKKPELKSASYREMVII